MKIERDERKFDFHEIGLAIKKVREREGLTEEQLACIVDRDTRTIMYHENDGRHPSHNVFHQLTTMFGISVDQFFTLKPAPMKPRKNAASVFCTLLRVRTNGK